MRLAKKYKREWYRNLALHEKSVNYVKAQEKRKLAVLATLGSCRKPIFQFKIIKSLQATSCRPTSIDALANYGVAPIDQEQVLSTPHLEVWGKVEKTRFLREFLEFPQITFG